ncbi:fatty-acid amide hydrolase 2-B [Parasteatoda tepidariorum]|uniref:fatty-acid amide hydrolase 2-B n=1 Tax=Parasteatoda tepidariorum TaxID=114398 RepID=UPI00077FDD09|nr:fatty-acid amide hydrolase 2-B [Parasteatoda tepidariorum]
MDENAIRSSIPAIFPLKIVTTVLRGVRSTVENTTHGFLSILNIGCKKQIPPIENDLLLIPASVLAEKIRKGEISSEAVVKAYIQRIGQINGLINAVVEGRYTEAVKDAKFADQLIRSGRLSEQQIAQQLPLLGVPFTAKEALVIKGLPNTCGLVCRKGIIASEDCEPVQRLRACGAIPLALTNTSEICMWWETYNNLHGRTSNPYDTTRTVGGSSGGEAALIASGGSVIGVGTDLGGSIRLPSFFTGIFGHKPSQGYVPSEGQYPPALDEIGRYAVVGPMGRYVSDLKLLLSALVGPEGVYRLKLNLPVELQSIKVYYMLDDGGSPAPTPVSSEIKEGIKQITSMLGMEGLVVEEVNLKYPKLGFLIWLSYLSTVKNQRISTLMKGNVKVKEDGPYLEMCKWFGGKSEHTFPVILNACAQDHLAPLFQKPLDFLMRCGDHLKAELLSMLENENAVFIYPTFPHVAPHHGQMLANLFNLSYTTVFNAAQLPCTQCPIGFNSSGLPFGVQVVAGPGNDRLCLCIAEYIEKKLGGWKPIQS